MNRIGEARIALIDAANPSIGYQLRVVNTRGETVLFTAADPTTGSDLVTFSDALRVVGAYLEGSDD
jgi:hypothetical protein